MIGLRMGREDVIDLIITTFVGGSNEPLCSMTFPYSVILRDHEGL